LVAPHWLRIGMDIRPWCTNLRRTDDDESRVVLSGARAISRTGEFSPDNLQHGRIK
jgi:hypothetical protein